MRRLKEIIKTLVYTFKFYLNLSNWAWSLYFEYECMYTKTIRQLCFIVYGE
jgi:hypothetical protein